MQVGHTGVAHLGVGILQEFCILKLAGEGVKKFLKVKGINLVLGVLRLERSCRVFYSLVKVYFVTYLSPPKTPSLALSENNIPYQYFLSHPLF